MFGSNPSKGADSLMSSARPWGRPSTMAISTTSSARPFCTTRMAVVAPTNPLPTMVTFMCVLLDVRPVPERRSTGLCSSAVAGLCPQRPLELVAPLDERPRDGPGNAAGVEVAVRGLHDRALQDVPGI